MTEREEWKPIPGYEAYQISTLGRIRSPDRVLKQHRSQNGYWCVGLSRDGSKREFRVHRLALAAFVGEPGPGQEGTHANGDRDNNSLPNLAWVNAKGNGNRSKHGMYTAPEYNSWIKLKERCKNLRSEKYPEYGGRGIRVCEAWDKSFEQFYADMGPKPDKSYTIDRIDVDGDYEPNNCRWASPKEQTRNRRNTVLVEFDGRQMPLAEACEITGIDYDIAHQRLMRGNHWLPAAPTATGGR